MRPTARPAFLAGALLLVSLGPILTLSQLTMHRPGRQAWVAAAPVPVRSLTGLLAPGAATFPPAPPRQGKSAPAPANQRADYDLVAPPSLTAAQIDTVLAQYGSPAAGTGADFYALGVQYGIDPAFALGFFVVESQCGTLGVARFTHGIGNIRCTPGYRCYEGYRAYDTWPAGVEDWYTLIRGWYVDRWGLRTPEAILPIYAPLGDGNDPAAYAAGVESLVSGWRQAPPGR